MPDTCRYGLAFAALIALGTICLLIAFTPAIPPAPTPAHMTGRVEITEPPPAPYTSTPATVTAPA